MEKNADDCSLGPLETPVLFIVFNRPETTAKVFAAIRSARPRRLFLAADGPRPGRDDDVINTTAVRHIVSQIDWLCDVMYRFLPDNHGCAKAVSSAITWFFENVEEGIILEDDCLPNSTFFGFCHSLLARYRHENSITHIGGFNVQEGNFRGGHSYYFSQYFHVWGWATWRRAWIDYELKPKDYDSFLSECCLENLFDDPLVSAFWRRQFDRVFVGGLDTWDYQWVYLNLKRRGLSIVPNVSLVENIGFGVDATHTKNSNSKSSKVRSAAIVLDEGPHHLLPNREADRYTYQHHVKLVPKVQAKATVLGRAKKRLFGLASRLLKTLGLSSGT